ncbi:hypothetical protein ONS95_002323 [Cadophora gregata]|uniref:uncharacterized protein n=1 Tax=Cadophora gregata TaxID=51156 RepID=UPI0026DC85B7|nr:uncharacterized protein ONS95_002323 [Cadophora gregata]KAK0109642.1 hypothetical protein ONS95_002323 [Cadophora gregata]KAK0110727.1 hypothetical protein ONS96_002326 [Cadophora gregata f. sp. sojae]
MKKLLTSLLHIIIILGIWTGWLGLGCEALVTLHTIRNLTNATDGYRGRIEDLGSVSVDFGGTWDGQQQVVLEMGGGGGMEGGRGGGGVDEGEVEDTVAAALRLLCTDILIELEKPLVVIPPPALYNSPRGVDCDQVKSEYHDFLAATVRFLHVVQERQMVWRWGADSAVFDGVGWLQGLWASRSTNSQNRSFIEQQMSMYAETECFGKSNEVLRRDVEVVEYLNDLLDLFA